MPQITTHSTRFTLQEGETLLEALERTGHQSENQPDLFEPDLFADNSGK